MGHNKGTCLQHESQNKSGAQPCLPSAGGVPVGGRTVFAALLVSVSEHESTVGIDLGVANTF